ncbi:myosin B, putative (MyoB), partial [Plasmodium ovale curtisi]
MNKISEFNNYFRINSEFVNKNENEVGRDNFFVWTYKSPNVDLYPDVVFFKCVVLNVDGDNYKVKEISPETNSEYVVKKEHLFNCNNMVNVNSHRLNDMVHQNSAEVLNTLALRYEKNYIYTIAEPMLISINPYQIIDVNMNDYKTMNSDDLPPHVYTYAKEAMLDFINTKNSQSIIISGESGSGKTEASKLVIKYYLSGVKEDNDISKTLWDSNFILEAFGNAKTIKNNNSSRYGKYIKIQLDENQNIVSSCIEIFLLEKIRVVSQVILIKVHKCVQINGEISISNGVPGCSPWSSREASIIRSYWHPQDVCTLLCEPPRSHPSSFHLITIFCTNKWQEADERCYHIFYEIFKGMSDDMKNKYNIKQESEYNYISNKSITIQEIDDARDFENLMISLDKMNMSYLKDDLFFTLSGILLLGNIHFNETEKGGKINCSELDEENMKTVNETSSLLGIDNDSLRDSLIFTEKNIANQKIEIPLSVEESLSICRSISKDIYNKIFEYITKKVNECLNNNKELNNYIGILDIFGFEIFARNSLEQLLINIANEEIHNIYLFVVYEKESNLYKNEGIIAESVKYTTNE